MAKRPYTKQDLSYIEENYSSMDTMKIATTLGRTAIAINRQASKMGLSKRDYTPYPAHVQRARNTFLRRYGVSIEDFPETVEKARAWSEILAEVRRFGA
jgi:hypothetical protein